MAIYREGSLYLYGNVGDFSGEPGFTAMDVIDALARHGHQKPITVRINSGGGYVDQGVAIYNALTAHAGRVMVSIDAMAASAASLIAMAGDDITMRTGSLMMIHDPSAGTFGTASDHNKSAQFLERLANQTAEIYAARTKNSLSKVRTMMRDETWLQPDEAVAQGFATGRDNLQAIAAARFAYEKYAHAPASLKATSKRSLADVVADGRRPMRGTSGMRKEKGAAGSVPDKPDNVPAPGSLAASMKKILDSRGGPHARTFATNQSSGTRR